ncbi:MFS transporter [Dyella dinghuensis]|nr:MFS transporter [Dyella dinghuensis]
MNNRWLALTIIFFSFLQFTLNWFNIVPTFGHLIAELHLTLPQLGTIVGVFIAGYGLAHIPGGMLAEAFGMRFAMLFGIAVETFGEILSSNADSYLAMLVARFICGVGGSVYIGSAIGLTTAWFRDHELVTANGLITGVAFTVGAALGLYAWDGVVVHFGWRNALLIGAAIGAVTFIAMLIAFPKPPGVNARSIQGSHLDRASLKRVFGNRDLWILGLSFLGGYGGYFTAAELLPTYAQQHLGLSPVEAGGIGVILLVSGIPGSFVGGWLADKLFGILPTLIGAWLIESAALLMIPFLGMSGLYVAAAIIGSTAILGFVGWIAVPGLYRHSLHLSDVPTACGLMLTIAAIGGVLVPSLFGKIAATWGYPSAWIFAAFISIATMSCCFFAERPEDKAAETDSLKAAKIV